MLIFRTGTDTVVHRAPQRNMQFVQYIIDPLPSSSGRAVFVNSSGFACGSSISRQQLPTDGKWIAVSCF